MYDEKLFYSVIPENADWQRVADGFSVSAISLYKDNGKQSFIPDILLKAIHPLLPQVITLRIEENLSCHRNDLRLTLSVWDCETIVKNEYGHATAFFYLEDVDVCSEDIYISGDAVSLREKINPDTGDTIYLSVDYAAQASICKMWMNESYPAWYKRFCIATDLGLDLVQVLQTMFDQSPTLDISVPPSDLAV